VGTAEIVPSSSSEPPVPESAPAPAPASPPQTLQKGADSTLDALGLPPHPLVRTMDLAQYTRAKGFSSGGAGGRRTRVGSVNSEESRRSAMGSGRHARRHSGSSSGARFVVATIPPFRASRRGSDASVAGAVGSAEAAPLVLDPRNESPGPVLGIAGGMMKTLLGGGEGASSWYWCCRTGCWTSESGRGARMGGRDGASSISASPSAS
jgi:hypothetical protein